MGLLYIGCVPPEPVEPVDNGGAALEERNEECDLYISFAHTNYQNQDYVAAIRNWWTVIDAGCGERNAEAIWEYMGRSYYQLANLDSARWACEQGYNYLRDDVQFLRFRAFVEQKTGNVPIAVDMLETILEIEDDNTDVMWDLYDIYTMDNNCDERKRMLEMIRKIDSKDRKVMGELSAAASECGWDESEAFCARWREEPCNIDYGIECASARRELDNFDSALECLVELRGCDRYNSKVLKMLAETYLDLGQHDQAQATYEEVVRVDPSDYESIFAIVQILIDSGSLKDALSWAEKGVRASGENGQSFFMRAEVYFEMAESCSDALTFDDKAVYEFSFLDYDKALKKGYTRARTRRDWLEENMITKCSDWFMRPEGEREYSPQGSCYKEFGITRSLARKKC